MSNRRTTGPVAGLLVGTVMATLAAGGVGAAEGANGAGEGAAAAETDFQTLKEDWSEAMETLKGYSVSQRDKALAQGRRTLKAMDERLARLEARAEAEWSELNVETRRERMAALRALRRQRNRVAEWYGGLKHGSAGAWEEVKHGFVSAYDQLADSLGRAVEAFGSDAEEPSAAD